MCYKAERGFQPALHLDRGGKKIELLLLFFFLKLLTFQRLFSKSFYLSFQAFLKLSSLVCM